MSIALLVIDVQQSYVEMPGFKESFQQSKEYINYVSNLFREANQPVIHIQHIAEGQDKNAEGLQVSKEVVQKEPDLYVHKQYGNGFWKTKLDDILKEKKVDFVICCGLAAAHCVLGTYNGALERGYGAAMLQNGLIGRTKEEVKLVHQEFNVASYNTIQYLLKSIK